MKDRQSDKSESRQKPKKLYAAPELTVHGTVEEITQYIGGNPTDQFGGSVAG